MKVIKKRGKFNSFAVDDEDFDRQISVTAVKGQQEKKDYKE